MSKLYRLYRKLVVYIFIIIGALLIVNGVILFFHSTEGEHPLKYIVVGIVLLLAALAAKRFKFISVR